MQSRPNYEIKDVMSIPVNQDETSWNDMMHILDIDGPWDGDDVGANVETGDPEQRKVTFYLNADNRELKQVEQRIAKRDSERSVDAFREVHRTLLCFHLYSLAARDESRDLASYSYRDEMIRVSQTLLYTHREFMDAFPSGADGLGLLGSHWVPIGLTSGWANVTAGRLEERRQSSRMQCQAPPLLTWKLVAAAACNSRVQVTVGPGRALHDRL